MGKVNVETERLCPREALVRKKIPKKSFLKNSTAKNKTGLIPVKHFLANFLMNLSHCRNKTKERFHSYEESNRFEES